MKNIRVAGVVGVIVAGAMLGSVGVTAASAQPASISPTSIGGTATNSRAMPVTVTNGSVAGTNAPAGEPSTDRVPIGPIVDWIKRNASSVIPAMKTALRNGVNAFKSWWNGLAAWIRAGINAIAQMSLQELFSALWDYFFG
ncbi:hypothetical protein [Curtobacterium sp. 9128]|uniref:hypothetical protein n=1 Tax=Curtobacterium sp. 9128 TaxID=1793722 RepID=UPI0011A5A85B|nr:hypothetical protein [Curtobacterium sp. 9128]